MVVQSEPVKGTTADALEAAHTALEAALRLVRPGGQLLSVSSFVVHRASLCQIFGATACDTDPSLLSPQPHLMKIVWHVLALWLVCAVRSRSSSILEAHPEGIIRPSAYERGTLRLKDTRQ